MAIPGVNTIIRDRFFSIARNDSPTGPRIVVIAKRTTADNAGNVSDLDIVQATSEKDVITAFGLASPLHKAFLELVAAGGDRIFLVPLPSNSEFNHTTADVTSGGVSIFDAAFSAVETVIPDIIVAWGRGGNSYDWQTPATPSDDEEYGFHADNSSVVANNWAYKIGVKVKEISENTSPCVAVLGVKPFDTSEKEIMTPAQISSHLALSGLANKNNVAFEGVGPYVVVIASEVKPIGYGVASESLDFGYANGACTTAASISRLASYSAITNKPLYNVQAIRYVPTRTQQGVLATKGVNSVILNFNKIAVFGEGLTFAAANSDFLRLTTKRVVDEAALIVRQATQKFVGEPSTIQMRNSMETAISSALRGMQILGALLSSDFTITYVPAENKAIVDLVLTPAFELRSIQVQIAINV